jgi:hypothetical protein
MTTWRKHLFIGIAPQRRQPPDYLRLPDERTVILSAKIPVPAATARRRIARRRWTRSGQRSVVPGNGVRHVLAPGPERL